MPKLSPTMEEGTIAKWHKKEGEFVNAGDLLLEIATDKATVEHQALDEGWLRKILIQEGSAAKINQAVAIFSETKDESIENYQPKGVEPAKKTAQAAEPSASKERAPETKTVSSSSTGLVEPAFIPAPPLEHYHFERAEGRAPASPLARKLAKEKGLDLSTVKGSGPGGRVTSRDLEYAQPEGLVSFGHEGVPTETPGAYDELAMSPMRKVIAKRLQEAKTFIPHFYVKQLIDAELLVSTRDQLKNIGLKVTFNDLIIRACALALRNHPSVNVGFNSVNQTIIQFKTIDISIAVTIDGGLITPIIRHVDYKSVAEISAEARELADRAKKGKLKEEEYKGGSFCISNLGMFGISEFSAVINPPQAAILAVGGIEERPVVKKGAVIAGKTLALTLSADHRVIDGALAAQFLKTLQTLLENPVALIA